MKNIIKEFSLNVFMGILLVILASYIIVSIGNIFSINEIRHYSHEQMIGLLMAINVILLPWRWHEITQHDKEVKELKMRDRGRVLWVLVSTGVISITMLLLWGLVFIYSII